MLGKINKGEHAGPTASASGGIGDDAVTEGVGSVGLKSTSDFKYEKYTDTCLVDAIRSLGVKIPYEGNGPFKALTDGNKQLARFHQCLKMVNKQDIMKIGKYVLLHDGHFTALEVRTDGMFWFQHHRRHIWSEVQCDNDGQPFDLPYSSDTRMSLQSSDFTAAYKLHDLADWSSDCDDSQDLVGGSENQSALTDLQLARVRTNRAAALLRKQRRTILTPEQLVRIKLNRVESLRRRQLKRSGLQIPQAPPDWIVPQIPLTPTSFLIDVPDASEPTFLKDLHPHDRDKHIVFVKDSHTYYVNGIPTLGSVTGLIHRFAQELDADSIIAKMMKGSRWPRHG